MSGTRVNLPVVPVAERVLAQLNRHDSLFPYSLASSRDSYCIIGLQRTTASDTLVSPSYRLRPFVKDVDVLQVPEAAGALSSRQFADNLELCQPFECRIDG